MGTNLRHHGRVTVNFLLLMGLGGVIATMGLVAEPAAQAISLAAASIIAPGFEAIAKIPLGLALRRPHLVRQGLASVGAGYAALAAAAALSFLLLRAVGAVSLDELLDNPGVEQIVGPPANQILRSAAAAVAGVLIITANRHTLLAGALMAMELVPAAALAGVGMVSGRPGLIYEGLERLVVDILLVVVLGSLVLWAKKATVHRRHPLV